MATFPCISADRSRLPAIPLRCVFLLAAFLFSSASLVRAGTIITLAKGAEIDGKISIAAAALHVDGPAPADLNLDDVLEANFGDSPVPFNRLFLDHANQLPPSWKPQNIGEVAAPVSVTVTDGTFTVTGGGPVNKRRGPPNSDNIFFVGQTWTGDGEWTARLKELDARMPEADAGLMLRNSLDPGAAMCGLAPIAQSVIRLPFRAEDGRYTGGETTPGDAPVWLRMTRYQNTVFPSVSTDGKAWNIVAGNAFKTLENPWVGLFVNSHKENVPASVVFDHVSLTPPPSTAEVLPPGVLLRSGTFLAGAFAHVEFDPASPNPNGEFIHGGRSLTIDRGLVGAVLTLPITRARITNMGTRLGILMKNGDIMDGQLTSIGGDEVLVSSVLLGITPYPRSAVSACFVQVLQTQPGALEVRLRDGSLINASGLAGSGSDVAITDVSGLNIVAGQDEIAQIRAGTSMIQTLAQLDWKATPTPPAVAASADSPPLVQSWMGENQEQILETAMQTAVEFPLPGKFRALGVQVALSPDSPANSTATIRILADGREIARTPAFRAGDSPRFLEVTFHDPAHVTLQAESGVAGVKVLYLDPVAFRDGS